MTDDKNLHSKISAYIDGELSSVEKAKIKNLIQEDQVASKTYSNFNNIKDLFNNIKENEENFDFPQELFWQDLKDKIKDLDIPSKAINELDSSELPIQNHKKHFQHFLPILAGTGLGVFITVLLFAFWILPIINKTNTSQIIKSNKLPTKQVFRKNSQIKTVSTPLIKHTNNTKTNKTKLMPNPMLESIVQNNDSCIIESMSSKDDIVPTVFKINDNNTMITVIWLPFDETEGYI